jgi:hypothetical protein
MSLMLTIGQALGSALDHQIGVVPMLNVACAVILLAALVARWR